VLPLAVGEAEAHWVERAAEQTVRELEAAVRRARACPEDAEEDWLRLRTHLPPDERLDLRLSELARLRAGWDDLVGFCAHAIRASGMHTLLGYASLRHYVEERLQLSPARGRAAGGAGEAALGITRAPGGAATGGVVREAPPDGPTRPPPGLGATVRC
jgi:hypothetical protein